MLKFSVLLLFAISAVSISGKRHCLEGAGHKRRPTQEKYLQECTLYAKSSCCHAGITEELAHSPVITINTTYWNRCGNLSKLCESYMKKIECFYRCSPYAAHWAHHQYADAIVSVPMCQNFCNDWYEACKNDLTCVNNWLTDWEIDEKGENHCKNECIPYREMYANGTDICESMWGDSLKVSDSPCLCLQMDEMDNKAIKLMEERSSSSSSSSSSNEEQFCRLKMDKIKQLKQLAEEGVETY
ncbi:riboflavin-binding protein-like [Rhineura floridana]|uniref:riboflavin-binding protein-like n=1 Tax=Rhineura floridana TaxID=261503 RepID=UPI002AC82E09|nr:riboflavin-binding protein-like [Rhineura floridana]